MCGLENYDHVDLIIMVLASSSIKNQFFLSVGGIFEELVVRYLHLHNVFGAPVI
jgi:hypothetical protein